jgi:uncharacterized protein
MKQSWHDLLFAHWPLPVAALRSLVPPSLTIDTYDGMAWVSIVPFRMSGVRPRYVPGMPWLSAFAELNVRTYVRLPLGDDPQVSKPGVYFFSLDAENPIAVEIARRFFCLPYFNATMQCGEKDGHIHYQSERTDERIALGNFQAIYGPTGGIYKAEPGSLEHWLTERYALYTEDAQDRLYRVEIHHQQWPLQPAEVDIRVNTLAASVGLELPNIKPLVQFARRLDVLTWPLHRIPEISVLYATGGQATYGQVL